MMKLWESSSPKKIGIDEKIYPTSGKNKKAKELEIPIISEEDLLELLKR